MIKEDERLLEEVKGTLNSENVEKFIIVVKYKNGDRRAINSDGSLELFDWVKSDFEYNRKLESSN